VFIKRRGEIKNRLSLGNACYKFGEEPLVFQFTIQKNIRIKIRRTIILPVVLYERETWSLTPRNRLRVIEQRMLKKIFGPWRDEATWEWRRLHNNQLYDQA
jgi:hypothetical protein